MEERGGARGEPGAVEDGGGLPAQTLTFSGSGFLVTYHIGVAQCLLENAPEVVRGARRVFGVSAGSLIAAAIVCGIDLDHFYRSVTRTAEQSRRHFLGPMNPFFNPLQLVRDSLVETLCENAFELACGRLFISVTRVSDRQNILVSDFSSNEELIQALLCSCFIPVYCGLFCPTFRGVHYIDGGLTNNLPLYDKNTIIISPFTGEVDICPSVFADCFFYNFAKFSYALIPENMYRITRAFFPPSSKVLHQFLRNGYRDTLLYLLANTKILSQWYCKRSLHCLSVNLCLQLEESSNVGSLEGRFSWHKAWIPKVLWFLSVKKTSILGICRLALRPMQRVRRWFLCIPSALTVKHDDRGTTESQSTLSIEGGCSFHQTSTGSI
ncbi:patatin-like phospholipase domain-containing protein 2 isoform X2 [Hypanus sabinus]|uniref:patatin-like phospholipase domain-containing protein 2 isoform X2 n=1 Tax=Hypanus sabinus TaxID=79690 RepID=UPI0028C4796F|nr:patatin-like phospholipase domain-containing protein 2 isoform X2 [Hypanus sabinus]